MNSGSCPASGGWVGSRAARGDDVHDLHGAQPQPSGTSMCAALHIH